jgi:hypothetical protein
MAINIAGVSLNEVSTSTGSRLTTPGRIIQTVHTISTAGVSTTSTSPVTIFNSSSIVLSNASNRILIEVYSENRANDWGDGVWNLYYMGMQHIQTGTTVDFSSFIGDQTFSIRPWHKTAIHTPNSTGPHSYRLYGWSYSANSTTFVTGAGGDNVACIRLSEVAS